MRDGLVFVGLISILGCSDDGAGGQNTDTDASASSQPPGSGPAGGPGSLTGDEASMTGDPSNGTSGPSSGDPSSDSESGSGGSTDGTQPPANGCDPLPPPEGETIMIAPGDSLAD